MKNKIFTLMAKTVTVAMLASSMLALSTPAGAAVATSKKATLSRLQFSQPADTQLDFTLANAWNADGSTVTITWAAGFNLTTIGAGDIAILDGATTVTVGGSCGAVNVAAAVASQVLTLTNCAAGGHAFLSGAAVHVMIGAAPFVSGGANRISNPSTPGSAYSITLGGTSTTAGTMYVFIVDSDQVAITANIDPTLAFDLDVNTSGAEVGAPYNVVLGALTTASVTTSDDATINSIFVDLATNATGGAVVTVQSLNGSLKSTSVPTDTIPSSAATLVAGTEGYGICIKNTSKTQTAGGPLAGAGAYDTGANCTTTTHQVGALQTTAQPLLNTTGTSIAGGRAEIFVKAAISNLTEAHPDYVDTLTFLAAATF